MKLLKFTLLFLSVLMLNSCASGYKMIQPDTLNYRSGGLENGVAFEYRYNVLQGKYAKKEVKKGIRVVAIRITNNTENDLVLGRDIRLVYENGSELYIMDNDAVFRNLKQGVATYLLYLLLTPLNLYTSSDGQQTSSIPIGLALGPGIAGGNMIAAGSANKKFRTELLDYNITGTTIKKGETVHGLIGVRSESADAIKLKME